MSCTACAGGSTSRSVLASLSEALQTLGRGSAALRAENRELHAQVEAARLARRHRSRRAA